MTAVVAVLALTTAVLAFVVVSLLRSHADILRTLHDAGLGAGAQDGARTGPAVARSAPGRGVPAEREGRALGADIAAITGVTPAGDGVTISLTAAPLTLVAFLSSGCLTCRELWTTIDDEGLPAARAMGARLLIATLGPDEESPAAIADLASPAVTTVLSGEAWDGFGVPASPYFALVDGRAARVVGEGSGHSWAQVQRLLGQALADAGSSVAGGSGDDGDTMGRRRFLTGRDRAARADRALAEAGIFPGDASLQPDRIDSPPPSQPGPDSA